MAVLAVKQQDRLGRMQLQVLMTALLWQAAGCDIFYGKLVVKSKSLEQNIGQVKFDKILADKVTTHISKQGDVFHIHQPGLDASAGMGSVSFESARLPGYYLLQAAQANSYNLRLEKIKAHDEKFAKQATYLVNPGAGIDGADIFELFDKPGWYVCLQSHHLWQSALIAWKDDGSQETLEKCSFYIQDIPLQYLSKEVNLSRLAADQFAYQPTETVKSLLDEYFRTKEAMLEDYAKKSKAASVQKAGILKNEHRDVSITWHEGQLPQEQLQPGLVPSNAWNQDNVTPHRMHPNFVRSRQQQNAVNPISESYVQAALWQPVSYEHNPSAFSVEQASSEASKSFKVSNPVVIWPSEVPSNVDKRDPYISSRLLSTHNRLPTLTKLNSSLNFKHPEQLKERTISRNLLRNASLKAGGLAMSSKVPSIRSGSHASSASQVSSPKDPFLSAGSLLDAPAKRKEGIVASKRLKSSERLWPTILASTRRNIFKQSRTASASSHRWELPSELLKQNPHPQRRQMENSMERNSLSKVQVTNSAQISSSVSEKGGHLIGVYDASKPVSDEEEAKYLLFFTSNNPTTDKDELSSTGHLRDATTDRNDKVDDIFGGGFQGDDRIQDNDHAHVMPHFSVSNGSGEIERMRPVAEWHPESLTSPERHVLNPSSTSNRNASLYESVDQEYDRGHRKFIVISHSSEHPNNKTQDASQSHPRGTLGDVAKLINSESKNASLIDEDHNIQEQRSNNQSELVSTAKENVPGLLTNDLNVKSDPRFRGNETLVSSEGILSDHNINSSYIALGEPKYHASLSSDMSVEPRESEREGKQVEHEEERHGTIINKSAPFLAKQQASSTIKSTDRIAAHPIDSDHITPMEVNNMLSKKLAHSGTVNTSSDGLHHGQQDTNKYVSMSARLSSSNDQAPLSASEDSKNTTDLQHDIFPFGNNLENASQAGENDDISLQSFQAKNTNPPPYSYASGTKTASVTKGINKNSLIVRDDQYKDGMVTKKDTNKPLDQQSEAGSQNRPKLEFQIDINHDYIQGGDSPDDEEDSLPNISKDFLEASRTSEHKPARDASHESIMERQTKTLNDSKTLGSTGAQSEGQGNPKNYANQTDMAFTEPSNASDGENSFTNLSSDSSLKYHDLSFNSSTNATNVKQNGTASVKEPDFYVTTSGKTFLRDDPEPQSVSQSQPEIPGTSLKNDATYAPELREVFQSKHDNLIPINASKERVDFAQMALNPNQIPTKSMSNSDVKETSGPEAISSKNKEARNELDAKSDEWDEEESEVVLNQHPSLPPANVMESHSPSPESRKAAFAQATFMRTNSEDDDMDEVPNQLTNQTFSKATSSLADAKSSKAAFTQTTSMRTISEDDDLDEEPNQLTNQTFSKATSGLADAKSSKAAFAQATSMRTNSDDDDMDEGPSELTNKTFSKAYSRIADLRENATNKSDSGEEITREEGISVLQAIATYLQGHNETKPVDASMDADRENMAPSISESNSLQESWQPLMGEPSSLHKNNTAATSNKSTSSFSQQLQNAADLLPAVENIEENIRLAQSGIPSDADDDESPTHQVLDKKNN